MYLDEIDALHVLRMLNDDAEIAFIVSNGAGKWIARETIDSAPDGYYCLWHVPGGALPLVGKTVIPEGTVRDPWAGWTELRAGADVRVPYFGPGHPGIIWWQLKTRSRKTGGIGMSSFGSIGNHYRLMGSSMPLTTDEWWNRLKKFVRNQRAVRIPRSGPLDGGLADIWAFPSALGKIREGMARDMDSF